MIRSDPRQETAVHAGVRSKMGCCRRREERRKEEEGKDGE